MKSRQALKTTYLKGVFHAALRYKWELIVGTLALLGGSGVNLLFPELLRRYLQNTGELALTENLTKTLGMLSLLFLIQGVCFFVRSFSLNRVGLKVVRDLRNELYRSTLIRDAVFFDRERVGDLVSRVVTDTSSIQDLVSVRLSVVARYLVQVVCGTTLMAVMSWKLTLGLIAAVLIMVATSFIFIRFLRVASREHQSSLGALSTFTTESFSNARLLSILGAIPWARARFGELNAEKDTSVYETGIRRGVVSAAFTSTASMLLNLLLLVVFWYGINLVLAEELHISQFTAFSLYGAIVAVSFSFLASSYAEVAQATGAIERVYDLIHDGRDIVSTEDTLSSQWIESISKKESAIEFTDVSFAYAADTEKTVLRIPNWKVPNSEGKKNVTAIMGPSGTGKSTLVALLIGLYTPTYGSIKIFGVPTNELTKTQLSGLIAWVPQDTALFGLSVLENVSLGNDRLTITEIERKISEWEFMSFVRALPLGSATVLGENGIQLSGGQKQRISIARALLRKPKILILDEATSGLDSESERSVMQVIERELPGTAVIIISHRLATTRLASEIVVLDNGEIAQKGSHENLKMVPGLYQRYTEQQSVE